MANNHPVSGELQGRRDMGHCSEHKCLIESHRIRIIGAVLCGRHCKDLRLVCGSQAARARGKAFYSLYSCKGRSGLRFRPDDGSVSHSAGRYIHHDGYGWAHGTGGSYNARRNGSGNSGTDILAIHTGMGGQPNRQPCDYRTVIRNDNERLRALFQALSIHGYRPHSPIRLCRRAIRKYRKKLFEIICGSMP